MGVSDQERKRRGQAAEIFISEQLKKHDYDIIALNHLLAPYGEIDIIARRKQIFTFVEVKARQKETFFGSPFEAISKNKLRKMKNCINIYLQKHGFMNCEIEILAAAVYMNPRGMIIDYEIIRLESL